VNQKTKLFLMFAPMALFFVGLAVLVNDMRHPLTVSDECLISAVGKDVAPFKARATYIYQQSSNELNDVSLQCARMGTLLLNDVNLFITPVAKGQKAAIARRRYHYLPDRWEVSVTTGKKK
jgi:hypothetical protein